MFVTVNVKARTCSYSRVITTTTIWKSEAVRSELWWFERKWVIPASGPKLPKTAFIFCAWHEEMRF